MYILPDTLGVNLIAAISGALLGGGTSAFLGLFKNDFTPTSKSVLADFDLIGPGDVVFPLSPAVYASGIYRDRNDGWGSDLVAADAFFAIAPPPIPVTAYGWIMSTTNPASDLLASGRFDAPFVFDAFFRGFGGQVQALVANLSAAESVKVMLPDFQTPG